MKTSQNSMYPRPTVLQMGDPPADLQSSAKPSRKLAFDPSSKGFRKSACIPQLGAVLGWVFAGVAFGAGGWILDGKIVRIPRHSLMMMLAEDMATLVTAETNVAALASGLGRAVQQVACRTAE